VGQPYVGQCLLVPYNFAPAGWLFCQGQLLPISENPTLFNLIGTTYGGDGQNTFQLPDLRGRIPLHQGSNGTNNYVIGQTGGAETVNILPAQYPMHSHTVFASSSATGGTANPGGNTVGATLKAYSTEAPATGMNQAMVSQFNGGNQPHNNIQPFQVLNWIISLFGIYPSQS
jgi:microcystin-dependent protein